METIRQLEALWGYASLCTALPASEPGCASFWNAIGIAAVAVFTLVVLYLVRRMASNLLAVRAAKLRGAENERVADPSTLAQYKADTDKLLDVSAEQDVAERIRKALAERQAREQRQHSGAGTQEGPGKP
jgi:flagellar biosynthesis/type III secretory pathway M-ring protein FliF/YscJ